MGLATQHTRCSSSVSFGLVGVWAVTKAVRAPPRAQPEDLEICDEHGKGAGCVRARLIIR